MNIILLVIVVVVVVVVDVVVLVLKSLLIFSESLTHTHTQKIVDYIKLHQRQDVKLQNYTQN